MVLNYLDCDLNYGIERKPVGYRRCSTMEELLVEIRRAGLNGGLIRCSDCDTIGVAYGNNRIAEDLWAAKKTGLQLWGAWALVPSVTGETPLPEELPALMAKNGIAAIYFNPGKALFFAKPTVIGDYCAVAEKRKIPVLLDSEYDLEADQIDELLSAFPKLVCRISLNGNCWPKGRQLYPLIDRYENTYIDLSCRWEDKGIEDMVKRFGAKRILMGSAFPMHYLGGPLAQIHIAEIAPEDKALIYGENLIRIIREADYR